VTRVKQHANGNPQSARPAPAAPSAHRRGRGRAVPRAPRNFFLAFRRCHRAALPHPTCRDAGLAARERAEEMRATTSPTWTARRSSPYVTATGATGLEPATFGVTGRTKCNGINDSLSFSVAETALRGRKVATSKAQPTPWLIRADAHPPITGRRCICRSRTCCRGNRRDPFPRVSILSPRLGARTLPRAGLSPPSSGHPRCGPSGRVTP
jgi:hypothetical protein